MILITMQTLFVRIFVFFVFINFGKTNDEKCDGTSPISDELVKIIIGGYKYTNVPDFDIDEFDFIVVGSGSAGAVIANRLSEISSWNILLLEVGRAENDFSKVPALSPFLQFTDYNWAYTAEPENNACRALENKRCVWPRGKALGGSSVINFMVYGRGNPEDYNNWASLGNSGWGYDEVLPYFLKSEDAHIPDADPQYHRTGGYLTVTRTNKSQIGEIFMEAGLELGYSKIDLNTRAQIGFGDTDATIKNGQRWSVASAFLEPVKQRKNLKIITEALVTKILIDPIYRRAYGMEFIWKNKKVSIKAKKEIIVSAGVLNSPKLLMLSGIGPKRHLSELGIPTIQNLPVGKTIYDHVVFLGLLITVNSTSQNFDALQILQSNTNQSTIPLLDGLSYIATNMSKSKDYPDIELHSISVTFAGSIGQATKKLLHISDDIYNEIYLPTENQQTILMVPKLLHPKSVGHMKLKSSNPHDDPLFYANYYSDKRNSDRRTMIAGIRFAIRVSQTNAFKKLNAQLYSKSFAECEDLPYDSDEYWNCALRLMSASGFHQAATCKMGPYDDPTAIVDNKLKVYGIKNLRVADSSIIPIPLSAHMNAPTIMIGEKASDLIKQEWGQTC